MAHTGSKPYKSKPGHKNALADMRGKAKPEASNFGRMTALKNRLKRKTQFFTT